MMNIDNLDLNFLLEAQREPMHPFIPDMPLPEPLPPDVHYPGPKHGIPPEEEEPGFWEWFQNTPWFPSPSMTPGQWNPNDSIFPPITHPIWDTVNPPTNMP